MDHWRREQVSLVCVLCFVFFLVLRNAGHVGMLTAVWAHTEDCLRVSVQPRERGGEEEEEGAIKKKGALALCEKTQTGQIRWRPEQLTHRVMRDSTTKGESVAKTEPVSQRGIGS